MSSCCVNIRFVFQIQLIGKQMFALFDVSDNCFLLKLYVNMKNKNKWQVIKFQAETCFQLNVQMEPYFVCCVYRYLNISYN